jgi:PilZ domain
MGTATRETPRRSERRPVKMIAHLFAISDDEMLGAGARTLDLSETGSRLRTVLDLTPGELIEFHPFGLGNAVLARVVWKENAGGQNEIGVEFLQNLPAASEA